MRTLVLLLLATLSLATPVARYTAPPPDLSTPKTTVRSFMQSVGDKDLPAMRKCVANAPQNAEVEKLLADFYTTFGKMDFKDSVAEVDGDNARIAVEYQVQDPRGRQTFTLTEILNLKKQANEWQIVPRKVASLKGTFMVQPLTALSALVSADKEVLEAIAQGRQSALRSTCMSNNKQIALGTLMYTQDYDELYPRKSAPYKELIFPYVKNNEIFRCPLDAPGTLSYTMNPNIQGVSMARIEHPAETVLFYEGKNGKLDFRHEGSSAVAFADGHVKMVDAEGAKALIWKVAPPPAPTKKPLTKNQGKTKKRG